MNMNVHYDVEFKDYSKSASEDILPDKSGPTMSKSWSLYFCGVDKMLG